MKLGIRKIGFIFLGIALGLLLSELALDVLGLGLLAFHDLKIPRESSKKEFRILVLGESGSFGLSSWPMQLEDILNGYNLSYNFIVYNEAVPGTNSAEILSKLDYNIYRYKPQLVVTMMGATDKDLTTLYNETENAFDLEKLHLIRLYKAVAFLLNNMPKSGEKKANKQKLAISQRLASEASDYFNSKDYNAAEKKYEESIGYNAGNADAYVGLGNVYLERNDLISAESMYKESLSFKNDAHTYFLLGLLNWKKGDAQKAKEMFHKSLEIDNDIWAIDALFKLENEESSNPINDFNDIKQTNHPNSVLPNVFSKLINSFNYDYFITSSLKKKGYEYTGKNDEGYITKYHYTLLSRKLHEKNITYFAMQYPTLSIGITKNMLENETGTIFISNEDNFKEAVKLHGYNYTFTDKIGFFYPPPFGGEWGHTTKAGHLLIAENVALSVLEVFNLSVSS